MKNITAIVTPRLSKGFTLIELLVVIGILGILAASLVATIDPFEQLKKAQDANVKNILVEFLDASTRYYTTHNAYPWDPSTAGGGGCNGASQPNAMTLSDVNGGLPCVSTLQGDSELKAAFTSDTGDLSRIYVTYDPSTQAVVGCFMPQSKSQQKDANTKWSENGLSLSSGCFSTSGGGSYCYWCTR
ncbi:MAG: prepilin-type N-terminal cleavage/methylation domain-containing protein [Patescibacteria group bacterium]|nr:prepilin-type N-terminal cleavage/methylation domain-containing protein [Patescibacteria group bacterium]MDE2590479.1 prepilin-type N-terminal cleavage/methylation domain-containing protein [Patescibacteria group bacterium]